MKKKSILVTGASGQLGKCLRKIESDYPELSFVFKDASQLDITNKSAVFKLFDSFNFDFCINCAAYTNVNEAEKNPKQAFRINEEGTGNISELCRQKEVVLLHISTDYVFDGEKGTPYTKDDMPNPINEYGKSKLAGERQIQQTTRRYYIIRTSWLYSEFGKNFYTTILKLAKSNKILRVTDEQKGCPTNANNLAAYLMQIIGNEIVLDYGIVHFTDCEPMTWFDFAKNIIKENNLQNTVEVVRDKNNRTFVKRPKNSVLSIKNTQNQS
ncbi:dTDP-4-dehydrorhamnose reductase [Maribacter sp. HTCC2170]|uniref:dTDP-4-dehydrorhamnose reductase n=1 Tax=Maribacter sp. (strain HTCC2170 / KCCM 42371) TaxID=313603 RepID=UPI00006BD298|nr:dTDP-4-dehydrorhamnose reductase [Maribacter sp. HTCC2170]EAR02777.1 dTDP-4-dehydrorhamnose reductase [Maribacter sp. HTCC2170]